MGARVFLVLALVGAGALSARADNPILDRQLARAKMLAPVNRARVERDLKDARYASVRPRAGSIAWYAVPAMSDRMRLADTYPEDGRAFGPLRAALAKGEFEAVSFQLFSLEDIHDLRLEVSDLKGPDGDMIPKADLDLRVVKLWLQNGNGWISFFQDDGLKLVPELLLHDENMIRVDLKKQANYACGNIWISAPHELDNVRFDPMNEPFCDADALQGVRLAKNEFKQFWLTVKADRKRTPGVYRGEISTSTFSIPLAVRVLPFELPEPRQFWNPEKLFVSSIIDFMKFDKLLQLVNGDRARAKRIYRDYLAQMRDHGVFYPVVQADRESYDLLREVGLPTSPAWQGRSFAPWLPATRFTFDDIMAIHDGARKCRDFYRDVAGTDDIWVMYGDEEPASFTFLHSKLAEIYRAYGIRVGCAGTDPILFKAGYVYGMNPRGAMPEDDGITKAWRAIGGNLQAFYANQHNGSENPQFVRTQHGLAQWMAGHGMLYNYEFAQGPWNDLGGGAYKPMVVSYLSSKGLVDTLAWNGYREAVDDIRYGTLVKLLTAEAEKKGNVPAMLEGKKALQYLALLPKSGWDPNAVRAELIERILRIRALTGEDVTVGGRALACAGGGQRSARPTGRIPDPQPSTPSSQSQVAAGTEAADKAILAEAAGLMKSNVAARVGWRGQIPENIYGHAELDRARELYRAVYVSEKSLPALRIQAAHGLCDAILETTADTNAARKVVADARAFAGLTDADRAALDEALGILDYRFYDFAAALPALERALGTNVASRATQLYNKPYQRKMERILECHARLDGLDATLASVTTGELAKRVHPVQAIGWMSHRERRGEALRFAKAVFDGGLYPDTAARLIEQIGALLMVEGFDAFIRDYPARAAAVAAKNPKAWRWQVDHLSARFSFRYGFSWNSVWYERGENAVTGRDTRWGDWLYDFVSRPPKGATPCRPEELFKAALFARNRAAAADAEAARVLSVTNAKPEIVAEARLYRAVYGAKDAAGAVAAVTDAVRTLKPADAKGEADLLLKAARFAMQLRREEPARAVYAVREKMMKRLPHPTIDCPFVPDAPDNIADMLASDIWKKHPHAKLDRPYGDNIDFLLATDMSGVGRNVTKADGGDFEKTEFVAFCDAEGVKILLYAHLDDMPAVRRGLRRPGNYEMYVASSFEAPYATFIVDMPPAKPSDAFVTQYSNETGFRRVSFADGTAAVSHRKMPDGIVTLVSLSWTAYFRDLPTNGSRWQFEPIHWERGGWSWGGSKTCHARSSFGSLVFSNLTPENLRRVRLAVVLAAKEKFDQAVDPNRNGCLDFWRDPNLGDRDFYFACLKPLQDRLAPSFARVTPEMSDADIDDIWTHAAGDALNIDYLVSTRRTDYLERKWTK